jgi:hypothetical protein
VKLFAWPSLILLEGRRAGRFCSYDWVKKKHKEERKTCQKFGSVRDYDVVDELDNFDLPETLAPLPENGLFYYILLF